MRSRVQLLRFMFVAPAVLMGLRIVLTVGILIWNPFALGFRFIQLVTVMSYLVALFMYLKLYNDGVPVISVMLPSILHFLIILVFKKEVQIIPLIPLLTVDIVFLVLKGIKASAFPFDIEDSKAVDDLSKFDESEFEEA